MEADWGFLKARGTIQLACAVVSRDLMFVGAFIEVPSVVWYETILFSSTSTKPSPKCLASKANGVYRPKGSITRVRMLNQFPRMELICTIRPWWWLVH